MLSTSCYPFYFTFSLCYFHVFPLSMVAASHRCCHSPLLKYCVRYSRSRYHCRFRYLAFDTLGGTDIFWPLLRKRWSWMNQICCCRSAKWDSFNIVSLNTPALILPRLYCFCPCSSAYLLRSLSSVSLAILHIYIFSS